VQPSRSTRPAISSAPDHRTPPTGHDAAPPHATRFSGILPYVQLAAGVVIVVAGLHAARVIMAPLALSVFAAAVSLPALTWLRRRGAPTVLAIVLVVILDATLLGFVGWVVARTVTELRIELPNYVTRAQELESVARTFFAKYGVEITPDFYATFLQPEQLLATASVAARNITSVLAVFLLMLLYVVFVLAESLELPAKIRHVLGPRAEALSGGAQVLNSVQRYLVLKSLISLATGACISAAAAAIGVDFALFLGLVAFLLNYIPTIGSFVAAVPGILIALLQLGPGPALMITLAYLVTNIIIGSIIDPIVTGQQLRLAPIVVLVSLVFWGWTWGPIGAFLSVPLTITIRMVMERVDALRPYAALLGPVKPSLQTQRG
jgi:AI-2 transport protein TqsA